MNTNDNQHNEIQLNPQDIFIRIFKIKGKKTNEYLSGVFKRSPSRISQMWNGKAPGLLKKVNHHAELLESKIKNN